MNTLILPRFLITHELLKEHDQYLSWLCRARGSIFDLLLPMESLVENALRPRLHYSKEHFEALT